MTEKERQQMFEHIISRHSRPSKGQQLRTTYLSFCAFMGSMKIQLFCVFLVMFVLKLAEIVSLSWWVVTAPLYAPVGIALALPIVFAAGCAVTFAVLGILYGLLKLLKFLYKAVRNIGR